MTNRFYKKIVEVFPVTNSKTYQEIYDLCGISPHSGIASKKLKKVDYKNFKVFFCYFTHSLHIFNYIHIEYTLTKMWYCAIMKTGRKNSSTLTI